MKENWYLKLFSNPADQVIHEKGFYASVRIVNRDSFRSPLNGFVSDLQQKSNFCLRGVRKANSGMALKRQRGTQRIEQSSYLALPVKRFPFFRHRHQQIESV